jgi:hypothetical protein
MAVNIQLQNVPVVRLSNSDREQWFLNVTNLKCGNLHREKFPKRVIWNYRQRELKFTRISYRYFIRHQDWRLPVPVPVCNCITTLNPGWFFRIPDSAGFYILVRIPVFLWNWLSTLRLEKQGIGIFKFCIPLFMLGSRIRDEKLLDPDPQQWIGRWFCGYRQHLAGRISVKYWNLTFKKSWQITGKSIKEVGTGPLPVPGN